MVSDTTRTLTEQVGASSARMSTPFDGRLVRLLREQQGLSAPALRERIVQRGHSLSLAGLTRIERGGGPSPRTAKAIADALGVGLRDLAG